MPSKIKVSGAWKDTGIRVKASGSWKNVERAFVKVGGVWRSLFGSDLTDSVYTGQSLDVSGDGANDLQALVMNSDGTKLYVGDYATTDDSYIRQYDLSTANDLSTGSFVYTSVFPDNAIIKRGILSFCFRAEFTIYVNVSGEIFQYNLNDGDLSTRDANPSLQYDDTQRVYGHFLDVRTTQAFYTRGILSDSAGFVDEIGYRDLAFQWGINTLSTSDDAIKDISAQVGNISGAYLDANRESLIVLNNSDSTLYRYVMTTPGDISTLVYTGDSFSVATESGNPFGLYFSADRKNFFVLDKTDKRVYKYAVPEPLNVN